MYQICKTKLDLSIAVSFADLPKISKERVADGAPFRRQLRIFQGGLGPIWTIEIATFPMEYGDFVVIFHMQTGPHSPWCPQIEI